MRRAEELIEDLPAWARGTPRQVRDLLGQALRPERATSATAVE